MPRTATAGGSVNFGDLTATVAPAGASLAFAEDGDGKVIDPAAAAETGCSIAMRRVGPYLAVADNIRCGGFNVSFAGIYARRRPPSALRRGRW